MAEKDIKYTSIEDTLFQLMQSESARDMGEVNLLVLISLVNMMGIIDIINHRAGISKANHKKAEEAVKNSQEDHAMRKETGAKETVSSFDPPSDMALLEGKDGTGFNLGQMVDMLSRLIATTASAQPPGTALQKPETMQGTEKGKEQEKYGIKK